MAVVLVGCHHGPREWSLLYEQAHSDLEQGAFSSALAKADRGLRESQHDSVWNGKFRVLSADIHLQQTHGKEALELLSSPLPHQLDNGEFAVRAKAIEGMALVYRNPDKDDLGRLKEAEDLALRVAPQLQCEVLLYEANQALKKGDSAQGDAALRDEYYALEEQLLHKALQSARQYGQRFIEAGALNGLGIVTTRRGRFDEAIEWLSSALTVARSRQYHFLEYIALGNLPWSYQQLGDLEKAIAYSSEALKVGESLGQDKVKEIILNNLGATYLAQGNYAAARDAHLKALAISRQLDRNKSSNEKPAMIAALTDVAAIDLETGNSQEAEENAHEAKKIDAKDPLTILTLAKIAVFHHSLPEAASWLQEIAGMKGAEKLVRWEAMNELANIFVSQREDVRAEREFQNLIDELNAARSSLHVTENLLAFSSHASRVYNDYINFLMARGRPREAFQVAELARARTLAEGVGLKAPARLSDIKIERIQVFLKQQNKAILEYWLTPARSFLWTITPSGFDFFVLGPAQELEQQAQAYNKTLLGREDPRELEQKGQSLYQALVAPAKKMIPREAKLVIVPHGGLTKLNFETLRVPDPEPHYWIKDVQVETASSSSLLVRGKNHLSTASEKLLAIGNPLQASSDYPTLQHAAEELERIQAHFASGDKAIISQMKAIPSAYLASHPDRFGLIHFVTHGTASDLSPLESAIILSSEGENNFKLYARDIVKIPLKADIVTISACYGAGKRSYAGEGLVGLAWAFLRAGAHQVVAGLWEVDDQASVDLMDDFYTHLPKVKSAATALRLAKLKMVNSDNIYHRPYYWASLQLYTGS